MKLKSLILASAAALVAGGAAQAADLPVAEPVDYVKVCNAYGAGYFFIPGTDTCLRISGSVLFAIDKGDFQSETSHHGTPVYTRRDDLVNFYTETNVTFDAREETDLGVLIGHMELDSTVSGSGGDGSGEDVAIDKAWLQLGGFYAGVTDSLINFNAGYGYDDFAFDHGDLNAIGYRADLGNGITASVALEEFTGNTGIDANLDGDYSDDVDTGAPGTTMPALAASIAVDQGWGSITVGGSLYQVRYANAANSTDLGYSIGGEASFTVMEGLTFGIAGGYGMGGALPLNGSITNPNNGLVLLTESAQAGKLNAVGLSPPVLNMSSQTISPFRQMLAWKATMIVP